MRDLMTRLAPTLPTLPVLSVLPVLIVSLVACSSPRPDALDTASPAAPTAAPGNPPAHGPVPLARPAARPLAPRPLALAPATSSEAGAVEAWRQVAVSPTGQHLAVVTADALVLLAGSATDPASADAGSPSAGDERWRRPIPTGPRSFVAFGRDGATVAVLVDTEAGVHLATFAVVDGAPRSDTTFAHLTSPPRERGRQPPAWPTGLMASPRPDAFWITNAYGMHEAPVVPRGVAPPDGAFEVLRPIRPFDSTGLSAGQGGRSYWDNRTRDSAPRGAREHVLERLDADAPSVVLPCYPQRFIVDMRLDRALAWCWGREQPSELHLVEASTSHPLGRVRLPGSISALALTDANTALAIIETPALRGWFTFKSDTAESDTAGAPVAATYTAEPSAWAAVELSPSGRRAVGVGRGFQVIDLESRRILCDHQALAPPTPSTLPRPPALVAAGFLDESTLATLTYADAPFNTLELSTLTLHPDGCALARPTPLRPGSSPSGVGKTTNLAPRWVASATTPGFLFNALVASDHGLAFVTVPGGDLHLLSRSRTPSFVVSPDGAHIGAFDHQGATVWRVGSPPTPTLEVRDVAKLILCDRALLTYAWNTPWRIRDYTGATLARFETTQPDVVGCHGSTAMIADRATVALFDLVVPSSPAISHVFTLSEPLGATPVVASPAPSLVLTGGPTGWRLHPL